MKVAAIKNWETVRVSEGNVFPQLHSQKNKKDLKISEPHSLLLKPEKEQQSKSKENNRKENKSRDEWNIKQTKTRTKWRVYVLKGLIK